MSDLLIGVFCEFDGASALGKARDLADSLGQRVIAISSCESEIETRLIQLGADEVIKCIGASTIFDWSQILSELIKDERRGLELLLGTSSLLTDAIFARVYALLKGRVTGFATGVDTVAAEAYEASKNLQSWTVRINFTGNVPRAAGNTTILSMKASSLPEPFEDATRYGKTSEFRLERRHVKQRVSPVAAGARREDYLDSSGCLSILVGSNPRTNEVNPTVQNELVETIAKKYDGRIVGSNQQEIYSNCLAIELGNKSGKVLPRFHGELIALVRSEHDALAKLANTAFVTDDIRAVLDQLFHG